MLRLHEHIDVCVVFPLVLLHAPSNLILPYFLTIINMAKGKMSFTVSIYEAYPERKDASRVGR
jgi:hypothetical protein